MLIDDDVLIDAGTGIGDLELSDLDSIRHVFLTHAHLDQRGVLVHTPRLPPLGPSAWGPSKWGNVPAGERDDARPAT